MCVNKNIKLYDSEHLEKFIEKLGHYEAAKIIKERNVDGQTLLGLSKSDITKWNLSNHQIEMLWNCISLIRSNPLTFIDVSQRAHLEKLLSAKQFYVNAKPQVVRNLPEEIRTNETLLGGNCSNPIDKDYQPTVNRKPLPVPRKSKHKYFKYFQRKDVKTNYGHKYLERHDTYLVPLQTEEWDNMSTTSSYSYHTCSSLNDSFFNSESDYIYAPGLQREKNNLTIDRIKKYLHFKGQTRNNDKLIESHNAYLELSNLADEPKDGHVDTQHHPTTPNRNHYDKPIFTKPNESLKKKRKFQCFLKVCCCSCFIGYPQFERPIHP